MDVNTITLFVLILFGLSLLVTFGYQYWRSMQIYQDPPVFEMEEFQIRQMKSISPLPQECKATIANLISFRKNIHWNFEKHSNIFEFPDENYNKFVLDFYKLLLNGEIETIFEMIIYHEDLVESLWAYFILHIILKKRSITTRRELIKRINQSELDDSWILVSTLSTYSNLIGGNGFINNKISYASLPSLGLDLYQCNSISTTSRAYLPQNLPFDLEDSVLTFKNSSRLIVTKINYKNAKCVYKVSDSTNNYGESLWLYLSISGRNISIDLPKITGVSNVKTEAKLGFKKIN